MIPRPADEGFSLVELIIAIFFLAILSLAVLPLLIGAAGTSTVNRDHVKATSFATAQLANLRAGFPLDSASSCAALTHKEATAAAPIAGPAGSGMTARIDVSPCPTGAGSYPASVTVTVSVFDSAAKEIATLPTRFRVASA